MSNVLHFPGVEAYPLTVNNAIFGFNVGCEVSFEELARLHGTSQFPFLAVEDDLARLKMNLEVRRCMNEWYSETPYNLSQQHEEQFREKGIFNGLFYEYLYEQRLHRMQESVQQGETYHKHITWCEPWLPPFTVVMFKSGAVSITGPRTKAMAKYAAHMFVYYLNYYLGVPATLRHGRYFNVVCDLDLKMLVDIEKLRREKASEVTITDMFPAAIWQNPNNRRQVALIYSQGKIVETGGIEDEDIMRWHQEVIQTCLRCKMDPSSKLSGSSSKKSSSSGESLKDVNAILRALITGTFSGSSATEAASAASDDTRRLQAKPPALEDAPSYAQLEFLIEEEEREAEAEQQRLKYARIEETEVLDNFEEQPNNEDEDDNNNGKEDEDGNSTGTTKKKKTSTTTKSKTPRKRKAASATGDATPAPPAKRGRKKKNKE